MQNFRLVILDYAKKQLDNPLVQKALNDMIFIKQKNYERTDPNYVVLDKHDMIGTHILIYETSNLYNPRLVVAQRITYDNRAQIHKVNTPLSDLIPHLNPNCQQAHKNFHLQNPIYAEYNSFFIDPDFSFKKSGIKISDISTTLSFIHTYRLGIENLVTCTNEKYKTHRLLESFGNFSKDFTFTHPTVPDTHMLIMIDKIKISQVLSTYDLYKSLFENTMDLVSPSESLNSINESVIAIINQQEEFKKVS